MLWEKKSQVPVPSPAPGTVPVPKPSPDAQEQEKDAVLKPAAVPLPRFSTDIQVKDAMPKSTESVTTNTNHSLVGSSCVLKGDLTGDEDLLIEGQFDGSINLHERCLTIGAHGQVKAEVQALRVIISGSVTGNISARERIEIRKSGHVLGDLVAPSISIEDGAYFKGSIEILREDKHSAGGALSGVAPGESSV